MKKVKKAGHGVIFKNSFLELFTRTNPAVHVLTYGGVIVFFLYFNKSDLLQTFLLFLSGLFIWSLTEYLIHRYLFHINESKFQYMIHGVHHEYPRDKERLMMPPVPGLIITSIFFGLWYLVFNIRAHALMGGFMTGYLLYTFIHYIIHTWKPVKGIRFLWTHHHKHHNPAHEDKAFGVSTPFWDYVFGTMPDEKEHAVHDEQPGEG
jgi:sterol desaturase/sphingolipid hydroxylase (fatty acid hydroxylase superfamily)